MDLATRPIEPSDVPAVVAMAPEPAADERAPGGGEAVGFRPEWWVLNWNPAREFYHSIGAAAMDEWIPYRLAGEPLRALAAPRPYQSLRGGLRV